jgi:hypothetical protein
MQATTGFLFLANASAQFPMASSADSDDVAMSPGHFQDDLV